jgi:hypothetical protein
VRRTSVQGRARGVAHERGRRRVHLQIHTTLQSPHAQALVVTGPWHRAVDRRVHQQRRDSPALRSDVAQ